MSLISKFKNLGRKISNSVEPAGKPAVNFAVEFDSSQVTEIVKHDIKKNVEQLEGIDPKHFAQIYDAALRSISVGRDLHSLFKALIEMNIEGMTKRRAEDISRLLNNKATAIITRNRQLSLGITEAMWLYSGAPCEISIRNPPVQQDECHKAANGKRYKVAEGMFLDGKWTWPGYEEGCRCASKSVIAGFD